MKRLFILLIFVLALTSCSNSLDKEAYISSYYIDYVDNKYYVSLNLLDESDHKLGEFNNENLLICFESASSSIDMNVNMSYVKSVILNKRMLNEKCLYDFMEMIKNMYTLGFNFYIFVTEDEAKEIYDTEKIIDTDYYYSLYNDPMNNDLYLGYRPIHFLELARAYYDKFDSIILPSINVVHSWSNEKKLVNVVSMGLYGLNGNYIDVREYIASSMFSKAMTLSIGNSDISLRIDDYKLNINNKLEIIIKGNISIISGSDNYVDYLDKELNKLITECYSKDIDILNIKGINYHYRKNYDVNDISIVYKLKK
ncbi:MAG: hypothetical protein ACI35W_00220 [Anaeroplasmataceae bacterium]